MADPRPSPGIDDKGTIEIRSLTVLSGDGSVRKSGYVQCPRDGGTVSLRHCLMCKRFKGFRGGYRRAATHLACNHGVQTAPPVQAEDSSQGEPVSAAQTPISTIMKRDVLCVSDELSLEYVAKLFVERNINAVPVVDETGNAIGIISKTDILRERHATPRSQAEPRNSSVKWDYALGGPIPLVDCVAPIRVVDIMMPVVFTLQEAASVSEAATLMVLKGVQQLPIVSSAGEVVGLASALDILAWLARETGHVGPSSDL